MRRVPRPLRTAVIRTLAALDAFRSALVKAALSGRSGPDVREGHPPIRVVQSNGRHVLATIVPGATEWAARARNLHLLVAVLEDAEIDYFAVRGTARSVPCVAVPAGFRADVGAPPGCRCPSR